VHNNSRSKSKPVPSADRVSLTALVVALVLTNVWFFSQALTYVQ
jgi:hypothetical protein